MHAPFELSHNARRRFLTQSLAGAGAFALSHLLNKDGVALAGEPKIDAQTATPPHTVPRARNCIYIYLEGGPSQMDLFDPKPLLNERDGEPLPDSLAAKTQFAFLQKDTARLMGTSRTFRRYGECGMEFSNLLPHLAQCADDITMIRSMQTDQFNHVPAQLLMNCGSALAGHPSLGSWLCYGLGSETDNLPAYVALVCTGRGVPGGSASWSSGFLPSAYSGVLFGNDGDSIPNLQDPAGITREIQRTSIDAVVDFNRAHLEVTGDRELATRIRSYELAFRMQTAAPELVDLSGETQATLDMYGVNRHEPLIQSNRGGKGLFQSFSRNCLLARRMIERGVRVVNIIHSSWDHHSNLDPEIQHNSLMVDQPIAALLKDLKARGLLDDTLVVWGSEFGRTPLGENRPGFKKVTGRDHHPKAFSLWLSGGGVNAGKTIGETDEFGWDVVHDPIHVHDLHATLLHLFGLDHTRLTYRFRGRDFRLTDVDGNVVRSILG